MESEVDMTKDNFDRCVELVLALNPNDVQFNEEEFNLAMRRYLCGDKERLTQLNFVFACDWLLKDYIEEDKTSFEDFEDEVMEAYSFVSDLAVEPIIRFRPYRTYLRNKTAKYFEKSREERLEKNLQLNLVPNCRIEEVEDEMAEEEIYSAVRQKEIKKYLDRFAKKCSLTDKRLSIAQDNLGLIGDAQTRQETASQHHVTKEQVICASAKYMRELRKEVYEHPNRFPLETPFDK